MRRTKPLSQNPRAIAARARYSKNPEKARLACKKWRKLHPDRQKVAVKRWQQANPERQREITRAGSEKWRKNNPDRVAFLHRRWSQNNAAKVRASSLASGRRARKKDPEKFRLRQRLWGAKNRERKREYGRKWRRNNLEKARALDLIKAKKRYNSPGFKQSNTYIAHLLRTRIRKALQNLSKSASTLELLGCTIDQFRTHLQKKFRDGMTWANRGPFWEIDHKRPCDSFELSDPAQQRLCFHYSNMQPLLTQENRRKHTKFNHEEISAEGSAGTS